MKVDVYWNLHRKCFSIRHKGVVVAHATEVLIRDGEYVVQPSGRTRARETGHKVVHAFVRGQLEAWRGETTYAARHMTWLYPIWTKDDRNYRAMAISHGFPVRYNPMQNDTFVFLDSYGHWEPCPVSSGMTWLGVSQKRPEMRDFDPTATMEVA